jgi:hypothetical protein
MLCSDFANTEVDRLRDQFRHFRAKRSIDCFQPFYPPDTCCTVQAPHPPEHAGHHGPKAYGSSATASASARAMPRCGGRRLCASARLDLHAPQALCDQAVVLALQERLVLCAVPQPLLDNESSEGLLDVAAREVLRPRLLRMPTRRGTFSRPCVGRDPRKGQGKIPGAKQSAPELSAIPGGHEMQVPNRAPTYTTRAGLSGVAACLSSYTYVQRGRVSPGRPSLSSPLLLLPNLNFG